MPPTPPPPLPQNLSYSKLLLQQEKAAAPADPVPPKSTSKLYLAPKSLPQLFELLSEYAKQPEEFRVIAGNTGAGVYHDWPLERVLIDIKSIPDLTKIEYSKVCNYSIPDLSNFEYSKVWEMYVTTSVLLYDWPLERVLIDIKTIPDLTKIEFSQVCNSSIPDLNEIEYSTVWEM